MVVKFRNTIWPPPPQLFLHRRAALSSNSNGTGPFLYIAERTPKAVYIVICLLGWVDIGTSTLVPLECINFYVKIPKTAIKIVLVK
jgi:hypothetical protein